MQHLIDIYTDKDTSAKDVVELIEAVLNVCYFPDASAARDVGVKPKKQHIRIIIGD